MLVCEEGCTACGACMQICAKNAIGYICDKYGVKRAYIDKNLCVNCGLCYKTCPALNPIIGKESTKCYAAWSQNCEIRNKSASGGVATELYKHYVELGNWIAGVSINPEGKCKYSISKSLPNGYMNSKYTYSDTEDIFKQVSIKLRDNDKVLFIGLPCQVAGLKKYLSVKRISADNLLTVDLVCHGVPPEIYLEQHIKNIEDKKDRKTTDVAFRDPEFYTYTFTFTLRENGKCFYKKGVYRNDMYQIAYHKGIAYRDNCYSCKYANKYRQGDITLADFAGVGSLAKCSYDNKNVSCVLVNTPKGDETINELIRDDRIFTETRPIEEEYNTESILHMPTPVPEERKIFLSEYGKHGNFDKAMKNASQNIYIKNEIKYYLRVQDIRRIMAKIIPERIKEKIRRILR